MKHNSLASISAKAKLGRNVRIGDFTIVYDNVVLGDEVVIESHCVIGYPTPLAQGRALIIGERALIRSHSVFYEGSTFGPDLRTGHRVTVRENLTAGVNLQIGTLCDFQGHTSIGDYVRTHSSVHIGQRTQIGNFVWIFPYTVFTNDPHPPSDGFLAGPVVEDYAVIASMCCILPAVRIGARSLVGAHSVVTKDVEPDTVVGGVPARRMRKTSQVLLCDGSGRPAYPWMRHFRRGYPETVLESWKEQYGELMQIITKE